MAPLPWLPPATAPTTRDDPVDDGAFQAARASFWCGVRRCLANEDGGGTRTCADLASLRASKRKRRDSADAVIEELERVASRRPRKRLPLPLRCDASDPRRLEFPDAVVGDDPLRAHSFLPPDASPDEYELALRVGLVRLMLRFPSLIVDAPAGLVAGSVQFMVAATILRDRPRAESDAEARATHRYTQALLKYLKERCRRKPHVFTDAVVAAALRALTAREAKPRHLAAALKTLIAAPAVLVESHAEAAHIAACVPRLRSQKLAMLVERLTRRVAHPDAQNLDVECVIAFR